MIAEAVSSQLIKLRKEKRLSQEEVADKLGISQASYWRYESGKSKVSLGVLRQLAEIFEVEPWTLVDPQHAPVKTVTELPAETLAFYKSKIDLLEHQVSLLEARIRDKDEIIGLLQRRNYNSPVQVEKLE